jgi:hypothetical protein
MSFDFAPYVVDDQPLRELWITSESPYVVDIIGLEVELLFPNGVTTAKVPLVLLDGYDKTPTMAEVHVASVNDPPTEVIPATMTVVEGIPTTIDLMPYIADVDNEPWEIQLLLTSPFIEVDGFLLEVSFPEGTADQTVDLGITDGNATVWVSITFIVTHVNNPPTLLPIRDLTVVEDIPQRLDISDLVSDPDDPLDTLLVTVSAHECDVDGMILTFLYPVGEMTDLVQVRVSDGVGYAQRTFTIQVIARNDAPFIGDIPTIEVNEDVMTYVSLVDFIFDEDHPPIQLSLLTEHRAVVSVVGLGLNVLYTDGGLWDNISFSVSDGVETVEGQLVIHILEVNDLPTITGIGDKTAPYYFQVPSGTSWTYPIMAADADDTQLRFTVESVWTGFSVLGSELTIEPYLYESGDHTGFVNVYDNHGGKDRVKVVAHVVQRSQLPITINIIAPINNTVFEEGTNVTFRVRVTDPDGYLGESATVTWTSDLVGQLGTVYLADGGNITVGSLPKGRHTIYVTVESDQLSFTRWVLVDVGEVSTSSEPFGSDACFTLLVILIIVIAMGVVIGTALKRAGDDEEPEPSRRRAAPVPGTASTGSPSGSRDARVAEDGRARTERMEGKPTVKARPMSKEASTSALPVSRTSDLRTVREAIEALPEGLPSELSLYDSGTIAGRIVSGRKRKAPDGRLLAFVQGHWFYADPGDLDFLVRYDGPLGEPL